MSIGVIFGQMLVLFAMMAIGYFCYKKEWISEESSSHFSKLVVNVFNPVLVVNGVLGQGVETAGSDILWNLGFIVFFFAFLVLLSLVIPVLLRVEKTQKSMYRLMTIFGNIGFMGIPVICAIFGEAAMIYVAFYILGYNIMLYTCGVHLSVKAAEESKETTLSYLEAFAAKETGKNVETKEEIEGTKKSFLSQFLNPGVVAAILAVFIFVAKIPMPDPVYTFCDYMGNTTIPLSMLLIGVSMAKADLKEAFTDIRIYLFILIRMIAVPILLIFALKGMVASYGIAPVVFGVFLVELSMPVGSIIALTVREKGADASLCTKGIVLSTLVSIVTIPIICSFL